MDTFKEPINRKDVYVWVDDVTDLMCRISTLSNGKTSRFVGITKEHPWYGRMPYGSHYYFGHFKSSVCGRCYYPAECKEHWWFWFTVPGVGRGIKEEVMQRCRILAAHLQIEGTELAQLIGYPDPKPTEQENRELEGVCRWLRDNPRRHCSTLTHPPVPEPKVEGCEGYGTDENYKEELYKIYFTKVKNLIETLRER